MTSDARTIHDAIRKMAPTLSTGQVEERFHEQAAMLGPGMFPNVLKLLEELDHQNHALRARLGSAQLCLANLQIALDKAL